MSSVKWKWIRFCGLYCREAEWNSLVNRCQWVAWFGVQSAAAAAASKTAEATRTRSSRVVSVIETVTHVILRYMGENAYICLSS